MTHDTPSPNIAVTPPPTDEELAAIVAAVSAALASRPAPENDPSPATSRWARAGRTEALKPWSDQHNDR